MSAEGAYIVARRWRVDEPFDLVSNCAIYSYFTEIQKGDLENAEEYLTHGMK